MDRAIIITIDKNMEIKNFSSAYAHIESEQNGLRLEADVAIQNGTATDITNGHIIKKEEEMEVTVADFSNYKGVSHFTLYGEFDTTMQVELLNGINAFCGELRDKNYTLGTL